MSVDANSHNRSTGIGLSEFITFPEKRKVPNHLLDTHIYTNECDNEIFHCRPSVIHFQGFHAGGEYSQKVRIMNVSSECQRMHVIPPSSNVFKIHYSKGNSLVPGMYLEVKIVFLPQENVYHHDCIRIHSKSATNLTIPIYAYLTMDISSFPNRIQFKSTQVGHCAVKKIPLKNVAPVDFSFQIAFIQQNPSAFDIYPLSGIIPANSYIDILIKYSPTQYCTSNVGIQIIISQFNFQPYHCTITGTSEPGIASKLKVKQMETSREIIDARNISPLGRSQIKKQTDNLVLKNLVEENSVKNGLKFPLNLTGHSAVSYILSQKTGKLRAKDVKEAVKQTDSSCSSKQVKQAIFEHVMLQNIAEEQRNQLRWGVKLGDSSMTQLYQEDILKQRERAMKDYLTMQGNCDKNIEFLRSTVLWCSDRVWRHADERSVSQPTFDLFLNDDWQKRHLVLGNFVQAARKVIWISRATKSLKAMGVYLNDWRHGSFNKCTKLHEDDNVEQGLAEKVSLEILGTNILTFSFPTNNNSQFKDDTAVDALSILPVKETRTCFEPKVCLYDLKVPLQYNLLHYNVQPFSSATINYLPNKLSRQLRTEIDIEVTQETAVEETESSVDREEIIGDTSICSYNSSQSVTAPFNFLEQEIYHPLHIFNPMPGICAHVEPLPYSEIDDDYSLSPLSLAMPRLDREGVIPGAMNWKKFPSHGLLAMSSPSLYNVYVPRWSDSFGEDLTFLPAPSLLTSLPPDDQVELELSEPDDISNVTVPNIDMVNAEFNVMDNIVDNLDNNEFADSMISSSINNPLSKCGLVPRDQMKKELNKYLHKQMNNLGNRVKSCVSSFDPMWAMGEFS